MVCMPPRFICLSLFIVSGLAFKFEKNNRKKNITKNHINPPTNKASSKITFFKGLFISSILFKIYSPSKG